jgi:hypothetical protein
MKDEIQRQILKKKALDRWENEGGRVIRDECPGRTEAASDNSPGSSTPVWRETKRTPKEDSLEY